MKFSELETGDIILFKFNNKFFHAAIFAPFDDRITNIIDVTSTKGCTRGTLEGLTGNLLDGVSAGNLGCFFKNQLTVHVVRHCLLNGTEIAEQAEFWRLTQVTYGIHRLLNLTESSWANAGKSNQEENLQVYCQYARRVNGVMIDNPITPSRLVIFLSIFTAPLLNLPTMCVSFVINFIRYLQPEPNPGISCAGFVLSVLGAVALKKSDFSDTVNCRQALGSLVSVNPDKYHPDLIETVFSNTETFIQLGQLDMHHLSSTKFNRALFHEEMEADSRAMNNIRNILC